MNQMRSSGLRKFNFTKVLSRRDAKLFVKYQLSNFEASRLGGNVLSVAKPSTVRWNIEHEKCRLAVPVLLLIT